MAAPDWDFSFDPSLPSDRDMVRFLIGDTDSSSPLIGDAAIDAMLTLYGSTLSAGAAIADGFAATFAKIPTVTIDGATMTGVDRAEQFRAIATRLRTQSVTSAAGGLGSPFVGGISISDMDANQDDTDRNPSQFEVGQFDYPGTALASSNTDADDS